MKPGAEADGPPPAGSRDAKAKRSQPTAPVLPWKPEVPYRYLWMRGREKVGETRFRFREVVEGGRPAYEITTSRAYDYANRSQRATSTTRILQGGSPVRFAESCELTTVQSMRAHQTTEISVSDGKARVKYVQNGREERPTIREIELSAGTYLFASQAVEHWAVLAARLPPEGQSHVLKILYPDFQRVFEVTFQRTGEETIEIGGATVATTAYAFRSQEGQLRGTIWLDDLRRLVQIEFPGPPSDPTPLRVVLVPERAGEQSR